MIDGVERHYEHIDQLQYVAFGLIRQIIQETTSLRRESLSKQASQQLNDIRNTLRIIDTKLQGTHGDSGAKAKYQVYQERFLGLKTQLRQSQLKAYGHEFEQVHHQRVQKYVAPVLERMERNRSSSSLRDELFAGRSAEDQKAANDSTVKDQILIHNKNITNSLQLTRQLMATSIMQTELNIDSVDQQSKDLSTLNDKLLDLNVVLKRSKQIVRFIEKQDKKDKQRIYLSIGFLLLCCAWVIWRRILKLPVKILLWTFFKLFGIVSWFGSASPSQKIEVYATVGDTLSEFTGSLNVNEEFVQELRTDSDETTTTWDDILEETARRIIDEL